MTKEINRLLDIEPSFVSLVTAGANRRSKFHVVKSDTDFTQWLDDAEKGISDLLSNAIVDSVKFNKTEEIKTEEETVEDTVNPELEELKEKNASLEDKVSELEKQINKLKTEKTNLESKLSSVKKSIVGKPTSAHNVKKSEKKKTDKIDAAFRYGGDLSAAIEQENR